MITPVDMNISTNNPLVSAHDRPTDHHELTASNTLALTNGSQIDRDQHIDDQFLISINHSQLSSANLPAATDIGHNNYAANSNS